MERAAFEASLREDGFAGPLDRRMEAGQVVPEHTHPFDARLLVLDDLGTESATPWAREKLFQLLNYRYAARMPTVITTSHDLEHIDERLASRMLDTSRCRVFSILAPSYRGGAAQRQQKRAGRRQ